MHTPQSTSAALPVTLIAGYLGAGKTTLINHLLQQVDNARYVVFVNDFGAINIDHALIDTITEDRIALTNGCVCCSLNADLVKAITEFCHESTPPDGFLIEASGIANPLELEASLQALEAAAITRLATKLYLFDAAHFDDLDFDDQETIIDHAAASDLIILSKSDLVTQQQLAAHLSLLQAAAPYSHCVTNVNGELDYQALVFDTQPINHPVNSAVSKPLNKHSHQHAQEKNQEKSQEPTEEQITNDHLERDDQQSHVNKFVTFHLQSAQPLKRTQFQHFSQGLSQLCYRAKGIIYFADSPTKPWQFHQVSHRASLEAYTGDNQFNDSILICIGDDKTLDRDVLTRLLDQSQIQFEII